MIDLPEIELLEAPATMTEYSIVDVIMRHIRHEANEREPASYNFGVEVGSESTCRELLQPVEYRLADALASDDHLDVELREVVAQQRAYAEYVIVARLYF